jgi:hypothetical protein
MTKNFGTSTALALILLMLASTPPLQAAPSPRAPDRTTTTDAPRPIVVRLSRGGFDWTAAGIGAVVALGLTAVVGGVVVLLGSGQPYGTQASEKEGE